MFNCFLLVNEYAEPGHIWHMASLCNLFCEVLVFIGEGILITPNERKEHNVNQLSVLKMFNEATF